MDTVTMVRNIQALIDVYGLENVERTVAFIRDISATSVSVMDHNGKIVAKITLKQHAELKQMYHPDNFIMTIKKLREMTGIGLKEAKDGVEVMFNRRG